MNRIRQKDASGVWIVPAVLTLFLTFLIIVPLAAMFLNIDGESINEVIRRSEFFSVIGNSVLVSLLTTAISIVLAYIFAWCVIRTAMPFKKLFRILVIIPMLIPSISIGMGVVLLLGNNGIVTNIFGFGSDIYGINGIVLGSVLYSLPVAFLMIENILKFEDSAPYEAANVLGIPAKNRFFAITLPYLKKPMIAVAFSVFTLSFTDYGVPLMVGGKFKTLPVLMYQEVIGQLNFGKGCVYGMILLIPAVLAFVIDLMSKNNSSSSFVIKPFEIKKNTFKDFFAGVYSSALSAFSFLPIVSFIVLAFVKKYPSDMTFTFENFEKTLRMGGSTYLRNSVLIAVLTAAIGVLTAVLTAYFTARTAGKLGKYLHLVAMSTAAIPGIVLGLSYVLLFKGSALYGTLIILVMVNMVHFFSSPYLMMHTSFSKVNENLESVASTLGIGKMRLLKDVLIPKCAHTVGEMFSYFFVNCMMTISAVSFLANTGTKPISLMINQFEAQGQLEFAAAVSIMILTVNLIMKSVIREK
ncbi:MAG: ABC transporter permease subunit [Oscillospiraceae bacterium]|nr:ABC transporter permease subunit [Oscillospiraceae bacterium]